MYLAMQMVKNNYTIIKRKNFSSLLIGIILFMLLISNHGQLRAQKIDSARRVKNVILAESLVYTASMIYLGTIWYEDRGDNSFRFYNDNRQWLQMDKLGHAFSAYHLTNANYTIFKNYSKNRKKNMFWSAIASTAMLLPIEIFDGFSPTYGASWGDFMVNTVGAFLPFQQFLMEKNYLHPKFSFSSSPYASLRPEVLGQSFAEQLLKDYNGQTYWLSLNLNALNRNTFFPEWLAISFGYGGDRMLYGSPSDNQANGYQSIRQYYLSFDVDFTKFKTNSEFLNSIFEVLNLIKVPFPTIEWNKNNKFVFHPIYF